MSGYTNPLLTLLFWGSAAMLFLLWLLDFAQRRLWLETPYQRKFMGPLVLGFIGLAFLVGAGVWYYTKSGRIAPYPVVAGRFVYPTHPALLLVNQSDVVARDIKYAPALWNLDTLPTSHSGLPIPAGTFDWIPARKAGGPMNLFETPNVAPPKLQPGTGFSVLSPFRVPNVRVAIRIGFTSSGAKAGGTRKSRTRLTERF